MLLQGGTRVHQERLERLDEMMNAAARRGEREVDDETPSYPDIRGVKRI